MNKIFESRSQHFLTALHLHSLIQDKATGTNLLHTMARVAYSPAVELIAALKDIAANNRDMVVKHFGELLTQRIEQFKLIKKA